MRTKRRKVSARWLAGVVLVLACGVAEGAFMEFGGAPVDYVKIRLWKEDGELKSEFRGVETEFGEIAGVFRGLAGRGATEMALHWLVDGDVTVRELSAKVGALAAIGFTNQFFLANGETTAQHLEFDLADFAVWDGTELEEVRGEEEDDGAADAALAEVQARARAGAAHFTEAIAGADSLRVRKAELPHSSFSGPVAYETADPEEIAELGRVIRFEAPWEGGLCACIGEPTFEWLRDGELLVKATFVGGHEIRWHDGELTPGLTAESAKELKAWLEKRGIPYEH